MHGFLIFLCACPPECKNASSAGYLRICFQLVSFFQPVAYHHSHSVDSDKSEIAGLPVIYPYLLQGFITCAAVRHFHRSFLVAVKIFFQCSSECNCYFHYPYLLSLLLQCIEQFLRKASVLVPTHDLVILIEHVLECFLRYLLSGRRSVLQRLL